MFSILNAFRKIRRNYNGIAAMRHGAKQLLLGLTLGSPNQQHESLDTLGYVISLYRILAWGALNAIGKQYGRCPQK